MKVICKFNDPSNVLENIPDDFDYGLSLDKEYLVMGVLTFKESNNLYFLVDENGRPSWFPFQIFEISDNRIPKNWSLKINTNDEYVDYFNLIAFDELINQENYFNLLLERDEEAMSTYFKRKIYLENIF